jgi:two-component system nitrate/nitrite sensor histidine kinase NarX
MLQMRLPLDSMPISAEVVRRQEPVVVADVANDPLDHEFRARASEDARHAFEYVHAWMGVPLVIKGRIIGMLTIYHSTPNFYTAEQGRLVMAFANQVAIAMENARLYEEAEQTAVAAERNRLARELHDAVTQTLFAASLIANVLPALWDRNQPEARRRLDELVKLTRSALAEMRTLLVELRPAALLEHPLGDLLKQLAEASTGRAGIPVKAEVDGQASLPAEVQIALYRITQEALNNIAKHACASEATVSLTCTDHYVALSVCDNGAGFDPASIPPDHLGVGIMRERASAIGAALTIDSAPGEGTLVSAVWRPGLALPSH